MRPLLLGFLTTVVAAPGCRSAGRETPGQLQGSLVVFNAGSLAYPFRELLSAFTQIHPGVKPEQESSGSLEAARKLTELGKIPDVLAVADYKVITTLLIPRYTAGYVPFASNAMVLSYTDGSAHAGEITGENWWRLLLRPEVRWGKADPALDPNGYRTLMVFQLAERHYGEAGLAERLERAIQPRYVRPNAAQLIGLVQAGELDYAWSYRSLAATGGLRWVSLPTGIDLSDPGKAAFYAEARVWLPGTRMREADSVEFRGEPILYALTIPNEAPHRELAEAFVGFVLSEEGRAIIERAGLTAVRGER
ncbi:MAG: extracellular solute-binding protein [Gemmatimonadales bacterium]